MRGGCIYVVMVAAATRVYAQPAPDASAPQQPQGAKPERQPQPSDDFIAPSQVPPPEVLPPPPYPRAFVERPLVLPRGIDEVGFNFGLGHEGVDPLSITYGTLTIGGAFSTGPWELFAGINLLPLHSDPPGVSLDIPPLQRVYAGIRVKLPNDTAIDVQGVLGNVGSDYQRYSPSLAVVHKLHVSDEAAFLMSAGVDYNLQNERDPYTSEHFMSHRIGAFAQGGIEVQLTPVVALYGHGGIAGYKYYAEGNEDLFRSYSYGADLVFSASETVDVSPYFGKSRFGQIDSWGGGLSLNVRNHAR